MKRINSFKRDLEAKKAVKIIAGIDNFDMERVRNVVMAADKAGASAVDVSANEEIIKMAKETTSLPVFVSSIVPEDLAMAVRAGADAIEIGNFDALYKKGLRMSASEILDIVKETLSLVKKSNIFVCVTVPGHIDVSSQIALAKELEELNIDLIQTEGAAIANAHSEGARGLLETAQVSIANTIELARNVEIPVMTASGLTATTVKMAFAAGASAVGVGSCVNKLNSQIEMIATATAIVEAAKGETIEEKEEVLA
ncbi:MAG: DUF561 domain-containing protein [Clostridium sp.]|nr:DUF561 domain-containing protein [Clostridium sp.]